MKLGELIGIARECKGLTLRDLEKQSGVSNALISQIETGKIKDPGFSTVIAIAEALGLGWDRVVKCGRKLNPRDVLRTYECETCRDDPMVCASIPGLHHCEKTVRQSATEI